jgi:hypothetical protein
MPISLFDEAGELVNEGRLAFFQTFIDGIADWIGQAARPA